MVLYIESTEIWQLKLGAPNGPSFRNFISANSTECPLEVGNPKTWIFPVGYVPEKLGICNQDYEESIKGYPIQHFLGLEFGLRRAAFWKFHLEKFGFRIQRNRQRRLQGQTRCFRTNIYHFAFHYCFQRYTLRV